MEALHSTAGASEPATGEDLYGAVHKLGLPLRGLIGMDIEQQRQLGEPFLPLYGCWKRCERQPKWLGIAYVSDASGPNFLREWS